MFEEEPPIWSAFLIALVVFVFLVGFYVSLKWVLDKISIWEFITYIIIILLLVKIILWKK